MFPQFPNHLLPFPIVFLHVSPYLMFLWFLGCFYSYSSVFLPFPILDFKEIYIIFIFEYVGKEQSS